MRVIVQVYLSTAEFSKKQLFCMCACAPIYAFWLFFTSYTSRPYVG